MMVAVENGKFQTIDTIDIPEECYYCIDYVKDCIQNGVWDEVKSFDDVLLDISGMAMIRENGDTYDWLTSNEIAEIEEEFKARRKSYDR